MYSVGTFPRTRLTGLIRTDLVTEVRAAGAFRVLRSVPVTALAAGYALETVSTSPVVVRTGVTLAEVLFLVAVVIAFICTVTASVIVDTLEAIGTLPVVCGTSVRAAHLRVLVRSVPAALQPHTERQAHGFLSVLTGEHVDVVFLDAERRRQSRNCNRDHHRLRTAP